jgi:hypothetical protein
VASSRRVSAARRWMRTCEGAYYQLCDDHVNAVRTPEYGVRKFRMPAVHTTMRRTAAGPCRKGNMYIDSDRTAPLNPTALTLAFGVAGVVVAIPFSAIMGGFGGMMGGGGTGWMHGPGGAGSAYGGSMMAGGFAFVFSALVCGFLGGALAGAVSGSVYNFVLRRNRVNDRSGLQS